MSVYPIKQLDGRAKHGPLSEQKEDGVGCSEFFVCPRWWKLLVAELLCGKTLSDYFIDSKAVFKILGSSAVFG